MTQDVDGPIEDFHARLHALTPTARVTAGLLGANLLVFAVMVVRGQNGWSASASTLLAWGANLGPLTRAEWWRLITAPFLHAGLLHIALNMLALRSGGPLLERSLGSRRFLALYVLTAVAASLGSVVANSHVVSVGASGAVFGVFGALLGISLHHAPAAERWRYLRPSWGRPRLSDEERGRLLEHVAASGGTVMPAPLARLLAMQIVGLVILNGLIGLAIPVIDNAAHATGFLTGLGLGWMAAGTVSERLAWVNGAPPGPGAAPGLRDRSRWLVPAAVAVMAVLALNAVFPRLPSAARVAILDTGCTLHSGAACLAAARELQVATRGQVTPGVRGYLDRGCRTGSGAACTALALSALQAGARTDASNTFARACDIGDAVGCRLSGVMLEQGQGVRPDPVRAIAAYSRACDHQDAASCLRLAEISFAGHGGTRNFRDAIALADKACDLGEARGCTLEGAQRAAAKDVSGAIQAFDRACRAGEPLACTELGARDEAGNGVTRDLKRAAVHYEQGCGFGLGVACTRAGRLYERSAEVPNAPKAALLYERGCALGQAESCFDVGVMYAEGRGRGKDPAKALDYYDQACRRGLRQVCTLVNQLRRPPAP